MRRMWISLCLGLCWIGIFQSSLNAASRIKDIAFFEGVRDNQLVGYGLVVGLNGT
jgi:flagellar P-ring protein precursor FlgI